MLQKEDLKSQLKLKCYKLALKLMAVDEKLFGSNADNISRRLSEYAVELGEDLIDAKSAEQRNESNFFYKESLKSAEKIKYWLFLLRDSGMIDKESANQIIKDTMEISQLLSSAITNELPYQPFYDPLKSYEVNYNEGPFGAFSDGKVYAEKDAEPKFEFLGRKVFAPFGIPAGPLVNGKFIKAAMEKGFDICVYKTVRTRPKKVNDWPNVLPVDVEGDLTIEKAKQGLVTKDVFSEHLAITNSFGNPSFEVDVWQADISKLVEWANGQKGKVVCGMIEGTRWDANFTDQDFLDDWALAARLIAKTKIHVLEANFSCPNESNHVKTLLCFDIPKAKEIAQAVKKEIGDIPLVVKLSYFEDEEKLRSLVKELGNIVDGFSAINTIPAAVYDKNGNQALPGGEWRLKSGICGAPVKWAGLEMTRRLVALRKEMDMKFKIIGVGGVTSAEDYKEYISAGADAVMSATGAMWNPYLAQEIKESI